MLLGHDVLSCRARPWLGLVIDFIKILTLFSQTRLYRMFSLFFYLFQRDVLAV